MKTNSTPANRRTTCSAPGLNGQAATAAAHMDGRALDRLLRGATASQKAVIADDINTGRLVVSPLTARQSRLLAKASQGYTYTASKLTEAERTAVINGQSLSAFHNKPSPFAAWMRATNEVLAELGQFESISCGDLLDRAHAKMTEADRAALNEAFDRLAARCPNQMMAALDRHTTPTTTNNNMSVANDNELASQMSLSL